MSLRDDTKNWTEEDFIKKYNEVFADLPSYFEWAIFTRDNRTSIMRKIHLWVCSKREKLLQGEHLSVENEDDKEFLYRIIFYEEKNVDGVGKDFFSWDNYIKLISNQIFLRTLERVIMFPRNHQNYIDLKHIWKDTVGKYHHIRQRRILTFCDPIFSPLWAYNDWCDFEVLFNYLQKRGLFHYEGENFWFCKNIFLSQLLKEIINQKLKEKNLSFDALRLDYADIGSIILTLSQELGWIVENRNKLGI